MAYHTLYMEPPAHDFPCQFLYHLNFPFHMLEQVLKNEEIWFGS